MRDLWKIFSPLKQPLLPIFVLSLILTDDYLVRRVFANPIVPTENGTGSVVTTEGNLHTITGGTVSGDGDNLFHEFQQFNLPLNNIADFISTPEINNILTLTNGGNVSVLDGLLQVTGGNSNLFFVNPAGILIGENAALNLRGGFTVTTADQIGFGNNFLNLFDDNNYATLVGNPSTFGFSANNPGVIVNEGDLALTENQSLTLLGGTVINTGSLSTEDGIITLASVPGEHLVRISQTGSLLNLEIVPTNELAILETRAAIPFDPLSLPELLTGNGGDAVSRVAVDADGSIQLIGSNTTVSADTGTNLISGVISTSGETGGSITVVGDLVGLLGADLNASGMEGGGHIRIGGDYQGQGDIPNASRTLIDANSTISADALLNGDGGRVIIWANEATRFDGRISAQGGTQSGNGGFVEVSGLNFLDFQGSVDTSASNGEFGSLLLDPTDIEIVETGGTARLADVLDADLNPGTRSVINANLINTAVADVILQATNDIIFSADINIAAFDIDLIANAGNNIDVNSDITTNGGDVILNGNFDGVGTGVVSIQNSEINTLGGTLSASGQGGIGPLGNDGIEISDGSTIDTKNGNIELTGRGQVGNDIGNNIGVFINESILRTTSGNITIAGQGGASNQTANSGVLTNESLLRTETGSINIIGTAGNGSSSSIGVAINPATTISTNSGIINLTGVGDRTSTGSQGSGAGIINDGINVRETSRIEALAGGEIRLNGTGGDVQDQFSDDNNANTRGIRLGEDSEIFANNGNIFLTGRSQSNNNNVQGLTIAGLVQTNGSGNILLDGQGGTGEAGNNGVRVVGDALITAEDGNIQVNAISGNSVTNNPSGFRFESGTIQTTGSGNIAINSEASSQISFDRIFRLDGNFFTQNPVQLSSSQDLILSDLTLSYPLSLQSTAGNVQIGSLDTQGFSFSSSASNSLSIGNISSQGTPNSGDVSLIAESNILLDSIQVQSDAGNGGNVLVRSNAGSVNVNGQISTFSTSAVGNGGSVRVEALTEIQTGFIDTSSLNGNAGDVLLDPIGDIEIAGINATAPNGTGGTVDITAGQFFRATESFIDFNGTDASISTAGASNGSITIRHGGGITTPFIVGDGSLNGTEAAITTGIDNILPTSAFLGPYFQGDIQIITTPPQEPILDTPPNDDIFINDSEDLNASASSAEPVFLTVTYEDEDVIESILNAVDETFQQQYEDYFQSSLEQTSVESSSEEDSILINAQNTIRRIESATGAKPAIVYAFFAPSDKFLSESPLDGEISEGMSQPTMQPAEVIWAFNSEAPFAQLLAQLQYQEGCEGREEDQLFLILVTSSEEVISKHVPSATCAEVIDTAREFRVGIYEQSRSYLSSSQKLHAWLIQPLVPHLEENDINNLAFIMDQGLRATPLAALHNGQEFLIEDYSLGLLPSLNITDTRYQNVQESFVLPAGISDFSDQNLANLPAVPFEITSVTENWLGNGEPLLDEFATQNNLRNARNETAYAIVHLATHASFVQGDPSKSFIQLWDQKLRLSDVRTMGWHDPVVELLILSACETASDSYDAELGFAGFASQAGVKSTVASLWAVSDIGTAGLMAEFYTQLRTADIPVKAEAVRQTQLAMLNGEVQFESGVLLSNGGRTSLPEDLQAILADNQLPDLSHPFYWSGFTLVGSPW